MNVLRLHGFLCLWGLCAIGAAEEDAFQSDVRPLLARFCFDCHGDEKAKANLNLDRQLAGADLASHFKTWELVLEMLQTGEMPPEEKPQPSDEQRQTLVSTIRSRLDALSDKTSGNPGTVVMRRLTSAEYAYSIQDLTGLDLGLQRTFLGDAVGGEGFSNIGDVQFLQDSTLEQYLHAAKIVASHAMIGAGPIRFYDDPGKTGRELWAMHRIQEIYRAHGFRTGAGEGAEPYGLDRYPRAFYTAWCFLHRQALGVGGATLASLAAEEELDVRFIEHVWGVLNAPKNTFPTTAIVDAWTALPTPKEEGSEALSVARSRCVRIGKLLRDWQSLMAAAAGDEEEASVLTENGIQVHRDHTFEVSVNWPEDAATAKAFFTVKSADGRNANDSRVIWRSARVGFRGNDRNRLPKQALSKWLTAGTRQALSLDDDGTFVTLAGTTVTIEIEIPEGATSARIQINAELDQAHDVDRILRCTIDDGMIEGETVASTGAAETLLADPKGESLVEWKRGVIDFARKLPQVSHREPAPSDRDPIPTPFDNTYNGTERNLFHYKIKYHRDDDFLVEHILDDATRTRLDQAWTDVLTSFDYHDAVLEFVVNKFQLDLDGQGLSNLSEDQITTIPFEARTITRDLQEDLHESRQALGQAEPGHVDDIIQLASRAWRRPLGDQEKERLRSFYHFLKTESGLDHAKAIRALLARVLVSPSFLFRAEGTPAEPAIGPLSDWELASRLSYFLWSSIPDAALLASASAGELLDPEQLARHVRRMLRDPKARRFATEFFGQWFGFYRFDDYRGVDTKRFPEFTESLRAAMYEEAVAFFEYVVRNDRPVDEILFADYTFLNLELACHYGIKEDQPAGDAFEMIQVANRYSRGGLLRLGAVHAITSAPLRTSAVKRGDWVLRRVLGTPVPPPPPDAGSIPPDDVQSDGLSVRERLEAHRQEASCVNCHSRMDPLGFALEPFDVIGRWRDHGMRSRAASLAGPSPSPA